MNYNSLCDLIALGVKLRITERLILRIDIVFQRLLLKIYYKRSVDIGLTVYNVRLFNVDKKG